MNFERNPSSGHPALVAVVTRMIPPMPTPRGRVSNMFPGVKRSTISVKLARKSAWSVSDLVNAANFLDATPDELMNDAFMNELGMKKHQDRQGVPVGAGTPLYPVRPEAGNNGTASAGVARPRPFVAMVPPVGLEPDSHDSHPALAASAVPEERESR
ncbi:hypothetical protein BIFDEN_02231 [Bifidobacterium dentium ATCC 27678]|nr:hypothetical protein BIFDEN_02231 [Bifidobacterium dentium ATCC 27678]